MNLVDIGTNLFRIYLLLIQVVIVDNQDNEEHPQDYPIYIRKEVEFEV